jgi:hypothetical protein
MDEKLEALLERAVVALESIEKQTLPGSLEEMVRKTLAQWERSWPGKPSAPPVFVERKCLGCDEVAKIRWPQEGEPPLDERVMQAFWDTVRCPSCGIMLTNEMQTRAMKSREAVVLTPEQMYGTKPAG